ncbi:MAG: hypothetical protein ACFCD0_20325 [Gemmataceae bacterium]
MNDWDQASRFLVRLDPQAFFEWTLNLPRNERFFLGWADTRNVPFIGEADRIRDMVALFEARDGNQEPWAVVTELQSEPDALILGRMYVCTGSVWHEIKPDEHSGSRYWVSGLVFNMTGRGTLYPEEEWELAGLKSLASPKTINVCEMNATPLLDEIEAERLGRAVLPWVPLTQGGNQDDIIQRWKSLGELEENSRKRGAYRDVVLILADKMGRRSSWEQALEDWKVERSAIAEEWRKEAREEGREEGKQEGREEGVVLGLVEALSFSLETKFEAEATKITGQLTQITDREVLRKLLHGLPKADTLADFEKLID